MTIIDSIRRRQARVVAPAPRSPMPHQPEMLYIGCIDARLDPVDDIGIEQGRALIFRNIGALVLPDDRSGEDHYDGLPVILENVSIGAVLEFFLNHLPPVGGKAKHIVISGHTDCGGLKACRDTTRGKGDYHLPLYLETLDTVRNKVMSDALAHGWDETQILHALEKESVRQSVGNLMSYPVVQKAVEEGRVEIHGWVIDTATRRITELDPKSGKFLPMTPENAG